MQPTDKVILIRPYIDPKGNFYASRKDPYLYGELPLKIRDDATYVVPVEQVTVVVERAGNSRMPEHLFTGQDKNTINIIPEYTKQTYNVKPPVEKDNPIVVEQSESSLVNPLVTEPPVNPVTTLPVKTETPVQLATPSIPDIKVEKVKRKTTDNITGG